MYTVTALQVLTSIMFSIVMSRLQRDRQSIRIDDKFTFKEFMRSASSPHVVMVIIMFFMLGTTLYGLAFFLPFIVGQLGFGANDTQLLSVGPFVVGFIGSYFLWCNLSSYIKIYAPLPSPVTLISAYLSDRYESRGITVALVTVLAVAGFALYLGNVLCPLNGYFDARCYLVAEHKFTSYAALYLMVPGVYASAPVLAAWMANNSDPYYRRASSVVMGFIAANSVSFGVKYITNFLLNSYLFQGGILSIWSFPMKDGPKYKKATVMNLILYVPTLDSQSNLHFRVLVVSPEF